jgi:UDP-N-acetylmuramate: L-alanyl-gamma-D-glutamyl-meso-diaminopimelate ligase
MLQMPNKQKIYMMGLCGTGMGTLAGFLKQQGHSISGSDRQIYPPMSHQLKDWGIEVKQGYDKKNIDIETDLVIVGNVIRRNNPEATFVRDHQLPTMSMPEAIAHFGIGNKKSIVVSGTHGKTSTTALTAHILFENSLEPSYILGGALIGKRESFHVGKGDVFVIEGDEYDTAYFDKGPKFAHYKPTTAIITSLEFDHADIFDDISAIEGAFITLIQAMPDHPTSHLIIWAGAERACRLANVHAGQRSIWIYDSSKSDKTQIWAENVHTTPQGTTFKPVIRHESLEQITVPLWGDFAIQNTLAALASAQLHGVSLQDAATSLRNFQGIKRRLEVRLCLDQLTLVDDFGHHPTAIGATLKAARQRWPQHRIWAIFEPRSATCRRNIHQHDLAQALALADMVVVGSHERLDEIPLAERFSPEQTALEAQEHGAQAVAIPCVDHIEQHIIKHLRSHDLILVFSNGDFGGLIAKLIKNLPLAKAMA